jgi:hypothetical protein
MEQEHENEAIRKYVRRILSEQVPTAGSPPQRPQPNTQTQQPPNTQQKVAVNQQQAQKNVQDAIGIALKDISSKLPALLKNFADADKDGKVEYGTYSDKVEPAQQQTKTAVKSTPQTPQQTQTQTPSQTTTQPKPIKESTIKFEEGKFQENVGLNEAGVIGLVASAPAILNLGGKLLGKLGKKVNAQWLQNIGGKVANAGHLLHNSYIGIFEKALTPFMKGASKEQLHTAAEALFMVIVGTMLAQGVTSPDILTGVKGKELANYVSKALPKVLPSMGFA